MTFETFTWPSVLKRLRQMLLTGSKLEEGMNWNVRLGGSDRSSIIKSLANYLVLRGEVGLSGVQRTLFPAMYCAEPFCLISASLDLSSAPLLLAGAYTILWCFARREHPLPMSLTLQTQGSIPPFHRSHYWWQQTDRSCVAAT